MKRFHWQSLRTFLAKFPAFDGGAVHDGELLERYHRGDSAAFELLVHRHAEAIFGTCARVCRDTHDAEDSFQATFLVLARKAKSIRRYQCLAGWLHRVAHRVATHASIKRSKMQHREQPLVADPFATTEESTELQTILDAEINRLTDRYRLPVLLCYLQGLSTDAAAKQLGIPRGTVLSRLATARQKLTTRLTRRGVMVPTTAIGLFGFGTGQTVSASLVSTAANTLTFPSTSTTAGLLAKEIFRMTAWKTPTAWATAFVAVAGLGGTVWAVAAGDQDGAPVVKVVEKAMPQPLNATPIKSEVPTTVARPPTEDVKRAELAKREESEVKREETEKAKENALMEKRDQLERLRIIVDELEKEALHRRAKYAEINKHDYPEYDAKVLAEAISKIDAERLVVEDHKAQGEPGAGSKLAALNERRTVLANRFIKQEAEQADRNLRLELLKRDMIRLERLGDDLRTRLAYLQNGLAPPNSSSTDPAIQKLVEEVAELKVEMRKLAESKK